MADSMDLWGLTLREIEKKKKKNFQLKLLNFFFKIFNGGRSGSEPRCSEC